MDELRLLVTQHVTLPLLSSIAPPLPHPPAWLPFPPSGACLPILRDTAVGSFLWPFAELGTLLGVPRRPTTSPNSLLTSVL